MGIRCHIRILIRDWVSNLGAYTWCLFAVHLFVSLDSENTIEQCRLKDVVIVDDCQCATTPKPFFCASERKFAFVVIQRCVQCNQLFPSHGWLLTCSGGKNIETQKSVPPMIEDLDLGGGGLSRPPRVLVLGSVGKAAGGTDTTPRPFPWPRGMTLWLTTPMITPTIHGSNVWVF